MTQSAEKFAQMLTAAIHRICQNENKSVRIVQDELGYALGRQGGSAVERWRKGHLPPKAGDVETLARIFVQRGGYDQGWIDAFLESTGYLQPQGLKDELFPEPLATGTAAANTTLEPQGSAWQWAMPGLMTSLGVIGLLALAWLWLSLFVASPSPSRPLPTFTPDRYNILLLAAPGDDLAQELVTFAAGDLPARLAQSGLTSQVAVVAHFLTPEQTPPRAHPSRGADMTVLLSSSQQQGQAAISLHYSLADDSPGLQVVAASLSEPFVVDTAVHGSHTVARRLALIANAALGFEALHTGAYDSCSRRFHAALAAAPGEMFSRADAIYMTLGVCLDAQGRAEEARTQYEAALALNPNLAQAHFGLGNYWYARHDLAQAQAYYLETVVLAAIDPLASPEVTARAHAGLGNIALAQAQPVAAEAEFDEAIARDGTHPAYFLARAMARVAQQAWDAAAADLRHCLSLARTIEPEPSAYLRQVGADCEVWLKQLKGTPTAVALPSTVPTIPAVATLVPAIPHLPTVAATLTWLPPTAPPTQTPTVTHRPPPTMLPTILPSATPTVWPTRQPTVELSATLLPTTAPTLTSLPPTLPFTQTPAMTHVPPTIPPSATPTLPPTLQPTATSTPG